ncbi:2-oxoglutarate-dependent dioxygenase 11-like [Phragmites australis]|uniref:2-oxoglutarate-dependent dioxygenase 11-like n=1 Tax=Phragmites australis TaxID=29695 RepID=UPI002D77C98F|nr:2-oxoglutarate-dependent dioxygenase 11-like [Phragmites australis]
MADESWRVPTPVQEQAAAVEEPPSRYIQREQNRPGSLLAADMPEPIPVVDLSRLPAAADEAAKLRSALHTWGLFLVTNHGIETSLMDGMIDASREFFCQPLEEKQKYSNLIEGKRFQVQGYGNDPVITQDQILDWNDRLHLRVEPEDERNLAHWPKNPESFRDLLHEYTSKAKKVRDIIFQATAKILELDEDYFINDKAPAFARFNYYPPCPRPELVFGIKPHSDASVLTILLVDNDVGGLQVQRDGIWYTVPSKPHTLLINVGDSMEIMSNGIFKSPVHRVVTNAEKERISLAMFCSMIGDRVLEPAAGLLDEERPARYRKIKAMDYAAGLHKHFSKGTRLIETMKL